MRRPLVLGVSVRLAGDAGQVAHGQERGGIGSRSESRMQTDAVDLLELEHAAFLLRYRGLTGGTKGNKVTSGKARHMAWGPFGLYQTAHSHTSKTSVSMCPVQGETPVLPTASRSRREQMGRGREPGRWTFGFSVCASDSGVCMYGAPASS